MPAAPGLIAGQYRPDFTAPLEAAADGLPAWTAQDLRAGSDSQALRPGLMAVQVRRDMPLRGRSIATLANQAIDGVLLPVAHGAAPGPDGRAACFVVCRAPAGPALSLARPWPEAELIDLVLRPAAAALDALHAREVTHRAIHPGNLFRDGATQGVTLGCAWAAPPGSRQPAVFEPPYSAPCLPGGRGSGSIADDVYALGVTLLALALGRVPLADLDPAEMVRRKLDQGSFAALAGTERLPSVIADLVRSMLAEDPEHRPPPALLIHPTIARARRVAARPPRRAQRPMDVGGQPAWNARSLGHLLASTPEVGASLLRGGAVGAWLRRGLGEPTLASQVEEAVQSEAGESLRAGQGAQSGTGQAADPMLVMRAAALLDPLAPLWWRGAAFWPDGFGPALAHAATAGDGTAGLLEDAVGRDAPSVWAALRPDRCDVAAVHHECRQQRVLLNTRGRHGGGPRLLYAANPQMPCASPILADAWVARLADLLPALDAAAGRRERRGGAPVDAHIAAFVAARDDKGAAADSSRVGSAGDADDSLAQLRLLARLQARFATPPVPALAAWLLETGGAAWGTWRSRTRRAEMERRLAEEAGGGRLPALLALLDDPKARAQDEAEAAAAARRVAAIDAELVAFAAGGTARTELAGRVGREVAVGAGMMAVAAALLLAALG